ncbi:anthranilate synthase component I family protein [Mariniflexile ostreae]|uniref:Anthranilate synthase component I family protein n=1 Tax=Mariniflexile ostreae TaxID=1520892 RepID=A0ABV5F9E0_9FLAO
MRTKQFHTVKHPEVFNNQLLIWAQQFDDVVWLDSNTLLGSENTYKEQNYASYDTVLAVDAFTGIQTDFVEGFTKLKEYQSHTKDWIFGYLTYDLKNDVERLESHNFDGLQFPDLYFFQPKKLFLIKGSTLEIQYLNCVDDEIESDLETILLIQNQPEENTLNNIHIKPRTDKKRYLKKVDTLLQHIHRGNLYEANFCQEFYSENTTIDPLETYRKLNAISRPPFASFLKCQDKYLISASPERYIKKDQDRIISQPIKGTSKRSSNAKEDEQLKNNLFLDPKERSENVMIVDLVRNDLSKTALRGSVKVEALCDIYTFQQVHQMISTVSSRVAAQTHPVDILKSTFPMGSMTGAPKISAMEIIEELEDAKRGLYSGAVGYITPEQDFDFSVVIRSILYNDSEKYVSFSVGSAITTKSDPYKEYEECLIKAKAMRKVLEA